MQTKSSFFAVALLASCVKGYIKYNQEVIPAAVAIMIGTSLVENNGNICWANDLYPDPGQSCANGYAWHLTCIDGYEAWSINNGALINCNNQGSEFQFGTSFFTTYNDAGLEYQVCGAEVYGC